MQINKTIIAFILLCSSSFYLNADESEDDHPGIIVLTEEQISDAHIGTQTADSATIRTTVSMPAKIVINEQQQAQVVAKAEGIVAKIEKNIGDVVYSDEVLAIIESKEIAEAKAAFITALKREELAAQTLVFEETLKNKNISSEQEYLQTLLAAKEAKINLDVAAQQLYILGLNDKEIRQLANGEPKDLRTFAIKSPINGVVITKDINLGAIVDSDQKIFTIANLDTVWVEMGIYPQDLAHVRPGNPVLIRAIKGDQLLAEASITQLSPIVNEETRSALAIAALSNDKKEWFPGSYVCAEIVMEQFQVPVAVLKEAVHDIDGDSVVFITHPKGFEKREVSIGRSDNKYVEIVSGLDQGTPYASIHTFLLKAELGKKEADLD